MPRKKPSKRTEKVEKHEEEYTDIFDGPLKKRRYGIRIDDEIEVLIIAGNTLITVVGKVLSMGDELELMDTEGFYHRIMLDWVVDLKVIRHNRLPRDKDPEMVKRPVRTKQKKTPVDQAYG